jgi:putative membrane protein
MMRSLFVTINLSHYFLYLNNMIVRPRPEGIEYFLLLRGSILPNIWRKLAVTIIVAVLVTLMHGSLYHFKIKLTTIPFTLMGLALAIFLGFRNSASYERYWEGRKLWGALATSNRNLLRQTYMFLHPLDANNTEDAKNLSLFRRKIIYSSIAFVHALRHQLREEPWDKDVEHLLTKDCLSSIRQLQNPAAGILQSIGMDIQECIQAKWLKATLAAEIDRSLCQMTEVLGSCERIKNTPIPFSYSVLLHRTVYVYCYLLPFGLIDSIGLMTPVVVGVVAYTFFGLDAIGDEIEEPFGLTPNDLPLTALSFGIEISAREMIGDIDLPLMPQAIDFCLQ